MRRFELESLTEYTDEAVLEEIRRVAQVHSEGPFTLTTFTTSNAAVRNGAAGQAHEDLVPSGEVPSRNQSATRCTQSSGVRGRSRDRRGEARTCLLDLPVTH